MHCSSQSKLRASWRMVCRPSSSCATSSGARLHHWPVLRGHDRHIRDHRVFDQLIERGRRARAARRDDAGARLIRPTAAGIEQPVTKSRHRAGNPGIVYRGSEHERVRRLHRVDGIVHQPTAHAAAGRTAAAAGTQPPICSAPTVRICTSHRLRAAPAPFRAGRCMCSRAGAGCR